MSQPKIDITPIGRIELGVDGSDEYVLLSSNEDTPSKDDAAEWLLRQVYRQCTRPGGYFCERVTVVPKPYCEDQFIAIIHHRYDV